MSDNGRLIVFALGALAVAAGVVLMIATGGGGIGLLLIGAALIASLAIERRYGRPGAPSGAPLHHFEPTRERFIDDETGNLLEVWVDPLTGERRYEPVSAARQLPES